MSSLTVVIAHRGASGAHPPGNTVEAFRAARALGADSVELDVRLGGDLALIVHHDPDLPDGRLVADVAAADLPSWVPTLGVALDAASGMDVNVEIKADGIAVEPTVKASFVAATVGLLEALDTPRRFLVTSFDWSMVDQVRRLAPHLDTGLLAFDLSQGPDLVGAAVVGGHRSINPWDPFVTPELVDHAHAEGLAVHSWTVDDPERMRTLVAMGVDGIITNYPDVARRIVDEGR